jgi:hypothetical protein
MKCDQGCGTEVGKWNKWGPCPECRKEIQREREERKKMMDRCYWMADEPSVYMDKKESGWGDVQVIKTHTKPKYTGNK